MELAEVMEIVGNVLLGLSLATVVICFLLGLWRGLFKSALRAVTLIVSLVIALILVNTVLASVTESIADSIVQEMSSEGEYADLLASGLAIDVIKSFILAIVSPILFMVLYFVLNKLLLIVYAICKIFIRPLVALEKKSIPAHRWLGGAVGVVCALISLAVLMTPIGGYANLMDDMVTLVDEAEEGEYPEEFVDAMDEIKPVTNALSKNLGVRVPYTLGGNLLFGQLTSFKIETEDDSISTSLGSEVKGFFNLIPRAMNLSELSFDGLDDVNLEPLNGIIDALEAKEGNSQIAVLLVAEVCSTAAEKWNNGETYLEINIEDMLTDEAAAFRPAVEKALDRLEATKAATLADDLRVFTATVEGVKETYVYVAKLAENGGAVTAADVEVLLNAMTPESIELIRAAVPGVLEEAGVNDGSILAIADVMLGAVEDITEARANGTMTAEDITREAEAINTIMLIATTGEATEETADDMVEAVMGSEIMTSVLVTTAQNADIAGFDVSDDAVDVVGGALDAYTASNGSLTANQTQAIGAIENLFGIQD